MFGPVAGRLSGRMQRKAEKRQPAHAGQAAKAPAPATSSARRTICRPRSAAIRRSIARLPPPRRAPRHARPRADPAACCRFPYRETDSAASQCRDRRDRPQSPPSTHGSCRRRPRARTRKHARACGGRISSAETGAASGIAISSFCASAAFKSAVPGSDFKDVISNVRFQLCCRTCLILQFGRGARKPCRAKAERARLQRRQAAQPDSWTET